MVSSEKTRKTKNLPDLDESMMTTSPMEIDSEENVLPIRKEVQDGLGVSDRLIEPSPYPNIKWGETDKILDLIDKDKIVVKDGRRFPRVRALRRTIPQLVGPIISEYTSNLSLGLDSSAGFYAALINEITILIKNPHFLGEDMVGQSISASAAADSTPYNVPDPNFAIFATAQADTRAKGRSYVNLLGLDTNVAEELGETKSNGNGYNKTKPQNQDEDDGPASNSERAAFSGQLTNLEKQTGVRLDGKNVAEYFKFDYNKLKKSEVRTMNSQIYKWCQNKNKIPQDLYNNNY